jgi:hypothetical protein
VEQEIDAQIEQLLSAKRTVRNIDAASAANVIGEYFEQCTDYTEIDAQIEQLLSVKRTVRNIDAASAANVIGEYFELCTNYTESMPRRAAFVSQAHCQKYLCRIRCLCY